MSLYVGDRVVCRFLDGTQNVCFEFLYNFCLKDFSFVGELSEI